MPHWRTMMEKDYLGAWDLVQPDGKTPKDFTLEIARVTGVAVKTAQQPKGKRKPVLYFKGARKGMVCNTTNAKLIESMYGGDTDGWLGKKITLYQGDVRNPEGGTIKGICVRPHKPKGAPEDVPERPVDPEIRDAQNRAFGEGAVAADPAEEFDR